MVVTLEQGSGQDSRPLRDRVALLLASPSLGERQVSPGPRLHSFTCNAAATGRCFPTTFSKSAKFWFQVVVCCGGRVSPAHEMLSLCFLFLCLVSLIIFTDFYLFIWRERECSGGGMEAEAERESQAGPLLNGDQCGAGCHDPEIMTGAKIKSPMLNPLSQPSARVPLPLITNMSSNWYPCPCVFLFRDYL